ncbi:hypothetical protein NX774_17760 [Massilia agilis]|uniref:Response regulator receiver domain-containing protein n=1 Tax=Massilia agilis TaxID=1811226 RepID=A0ABT2DEL3_9BURK|nr:hypothetical protein [Massilia agilis]MCS0809772.1 hypothetical protein [Massilia agilis]
MPNDGVWIFVDDRREEARAFAAEFERSGQIKIEVLSPTEARQQLLLARRKPAGVLMDVDLSSIADELGTGPGIAQDIRTKQKAGLAQEFPIVRFSAAEPVHRNVLGDPSSDDLFELKILKNEVRHKRDQIVLHLLGLTEVYEALDKLEASPGGWSAELDAIFGIDAVKFSGWGHEGLVAKVLAGAMHSSHVAANAFCRLFLIPSGLLIDEKLLALRLGVDVEKSGAAWATLLGKLGDAKYGGVARTRFERWWARGLEEWWFKNIDSITPLASRTVAERVDLLANRTTTPGLEPLAGSAPSSEFRPWRFCRLGLESEPAEFLPVDPTDSVRLTPQADFPAWIDPPVASLRLALRARNDARLNQKDLERMRRKHRA